MPLARHALRSHCLRSLFEALGTSSQRWSCVAAGYEARAVPYA
jgi:hypothetical protein